MKYCLFDSFNQRAISHHRSIDAAVRAERSHARMVTRTCGRGSYVWYEIRSASGEDISQEVADARDASHYVSSRKGGR